MQVQHCIVERTFFQKIDSFRCNSERLWLIFFSIFLGDFLDVCISAGSRWKWIQVAIMWLLSIAMAFISCWFDKNRTFFTIVFGPLKIYPSIFGQNSFTVRPRGTRPRGTWTSLVHDFKKGSKIFEISDFGTWTSWYTILIVCTRF